MGLKDAIARIVQDGWFNLVSGLGTLARDRATHTSFERAPLLDTATLADLYHQDDLCQRVVAAYPDESFRRGFEIQGPDEAFLNAELERLQVRAKLREGAIWGRLYGGAVAVLHVNDPGLDTDPIRFTPGVPVQIDCVKVYDRRDVERVKRYDQGADPGLYADAEVFRIRPAYGGVFDVHRSRCLVFGGPLTGGREREANAGWDHSVLDVLWAVIRSFNSGFLALDNMLQDASTSVLKLRGLLALLAGDREVLQTRAALMDLTRSLTRSVMLDAESGEEFSKIPTTFTGVAEVMDRLVNRVASAFKMPVTVLMGQAPAGLNATGDSDMRRWYDEVESYRGSEITPLILWVCQLLTGHRGANKVVWAPFWSPTEKEQAEIRKLRAEGDAIYLDRDVYLPEEVAAARADDPDGVAIDQTLRARPPAPAPALSAPPPTPPALGASS